jgi:hypothetical protein
MFIGIALALAVGNAIAQRRLKISSKSTKSTTRQQGTLIFEDDFERNESQETKDEIGKDWGSNSKSRAKGNKQVDLRDGAMYIYRHAVADHGVSVTHPAEFQDGVVELRFMLENEKDSLGLNFADLQFKEVHAGHLCVAQVSIKDVKLTDLKTGKMAKAIHAMSKEEKRSPQIKNKLKMKERVVKHELKAGKWYQLRVSIIGNTMRAEIDGKEAAEFSSEGIAHPTKRLLRLAVPKNAVVDDVKIYRIK